MRMLGQRLLDLAIAVGLLGCGSSSAPGREVKPDAVQFQVKEVTSTVEDGVPSKVWLATHGSGGKVARFQIQLKLVQPKEGALFAFTTGAFQREPGSEADAFVKALAAALEAKRVDRTGARIDRLPFSAAILGQNLSRGKGPPEVAGAFRSQPAGGWIATKVFLAGGEGEVFLNLNPAEGRGEFSIKDPDYGDIVLRELSKVL